MGFGSQAVLKRCFVQLFLERECFVIKRLSAKGDMYGENQLHNERSGDDGETDKYECNIGAKKKIIYRFINAHEKKKKSKVYYTEANVS